MPPCVRPLSSAMTLEDESEGWLHLDELRLLSRETYWDYWRRNPSVASLTATCLQTPSLWE